MYSNAFVRCAFVSRTFPMRSFSRPENHCFTASKPASPLFCSPSSVIFFTSSFRASIVKCPMRSSSRERSFASLFFRKSSSCSARLLRRIDSSVTEPSDSVPSAVLSSSAPVQASCASLQVSEISFFTFPRMPNSAFCTSCSSSLSRNSPPRLSIKSERIESFSSNGASESDSDVDFMASSVRAVPFRMSGIR